MESSHPPGHPDRVPPTGLIERRTGGLLGPLAVLLVAYGLGVFGYGTWVLWTGPSAADLDGRAREYRLFRDGIYPNGRIEHPPVDRAALYSVYPPYAFPFFVPFFEPGGITQARLMIVLLSAAALVAMALCSYRLLEPSGRAVAMLGAAVGPAIAGNGTALAMGQFSIACAGLIAMQIMFLARRRPLAAGVCWALAMVKPQIGLTFALLFIVTRQVSGLMCGLATLLAATLATCAWTDVGFGRLVMFWARDMPLRFTEEGSSIGPGVLAGFLGLDHRTVQVIAVSILAAIALPACLVVRRMGPPALLPAAGFCALAGMFVGYHRHYDNAMLFPAALAAIALAAESRRPVAGWLAVVLVVPLLVPTRLLTIIPHQAAIQAGTWAVVAAILMANPVRRALARPADGIAARP